MSSSVGVMLCYSVRCLWMVLKLSVVLVVCVSIFVVCGYRLKRSVVFVSSFVGRVRFSGVLWMCVLSVFCCSLCCVGVSLEWGVKKIFSSWVL